MVHIYCYNHHDTKGKELCVECTKFMDYANAPRQMSFSREKKHMWKMPYLLLSVSDEGAGEDYYAVFWSTYASASPKLSYASRC